MELMQVIFESVGSTVRFVLTLSTIGVLSFFAIALWPVVKESVVIFDRWKSAETLRTRQLADRWADKDQAKAYAELAVGDAYSEYHRHTIQNWFVLNQIEHEMPQFGFPDPVHMEKLRYIDNRNLFANPAIHLLSDSARSAVLNLEPLIRNANLEIERAVLVAHGNDMEKMKRVLELVKRKLQFLYERLPTIHELKPAPFFENVKEIAEARAEEKRVRDLNGSRKDIIYQPVSRPNRRFRLWRA